MLCALVDGCNFGMALAVILRYLFGQLYVFAHSLLLFNLHLNNDLSVPIMFSFCLIILSGFYSICHDIYYIDI